MSPSRIPVNACITSNKFLSVKDTTHLMQQKGLYSVATDQRKRSDLYLQVWR